MQNSRSILLVLLALLLISFGAWVGPLLSYENEKPPSGTWVGSPLSYENEKPPSIIHWGLKNENQLKMEKSRLLMEQKKMERQLEIEQLEMEQRDNGSVNRVNPCYKTPPPPPPPWCK